MKANNSTIAILLNIAKCLCVLYAVFFAVGSLIFAIYSLDVFDGKIPFNFKCWIDFGKLDTFTKTEMVNTVSMLVTFPVTGAIYGLYVNKRVWDYALTTTVIHVALSCLVMLDVPVSWTWWTCLGISLVLMILSGEGVSALRQCRDKARLVAPEPDSKPVSYLYRR